VLIYFEKTIFTGAVTPFNLNPSFQIMSGLPENALKFSTCKRVAPWNGFYCQNENLAIVTFESLDEDKLTRILSPITITGLNNSAQNTINTFMDHGWDGFYTSMKRLSRFTTIIEGGSGMVYDINYKSTPPKKQKFTIRSNTTSVVIKIKYTKAGAYILKDAKGNQINANGWDSSI
jgi:hypothetical protein